MENHEHVGGLYICAVFAAVITLVILNSECSLAEDTFDRGVASQKNEGSGFEVFLNKHPPPNFRTNQTNRSCSRNGTYNTLTPRQVSGRIGKRIVGGCGAIIEEFPFVASLQRNGNHICCACLITESWVLTVAACFFDPSIGGVNLNPKGYEVIAGSTLLTNAETRPCVDEQVIRNVSRLVLHPSYDLKQRNLIDLVLVKMSSPFPLNKRINPAKLPNRALDTSELPSGRRCFVVGWDISGLQAPSARTVFVVITGLCMMNYHLHTLPVLQKVTLPLLSLKDCLKKYPWASWLQLNEHICTLSTQGKDACWGDTGGPLICHGEVVALVSLGAGCANASNPTVYLRLDTKLPWIDETTDITRVSQATRGPYAIVAITLVQIAMALASIYHT